MTKMRDLAGKFPSIRVVLDHCGFPLERMDEYFESWRKRITTLAEAEHVVCKISGLGMCDWSWTVDSIRPWIPHCIDAFGPERCIFATNGPVDKLFSKYDVDRRLHGDRRGFHPRREDRHVLVGTARSRASPSGEAPRAASDSVQEVRDYWGPPRPGSQSLSHESCQYCGPEIDTLFGRELRSGWLTALAYESTMALVEMVRRPSSAKCRPGGPSGGGREALLSRPANR